MGMGGVPAGGYVKVILAIIAIVTLLAFMAAIGMTDTVAQLTTSRVEVIEREAVVNQEVDQWNIERPFYQEWVEEDYAARLAQATQNRLLTEAETAAELAAIQAAAENYQTGLIDQRQMALADQQQKLVQSDRWNLVSTTLFAVLGVVTIMTLAILTILVVNRKLTLQSAVVTTTGVQSNDIWRDPVERRKRIDMLREIDRRERQRMLWQSSRNGYSNGHRMSDSVTPSSSDLIGHN